MESLEDFVFKYMNKIKANSGFYVGVYAGDKFNFRCQNSAGNYTGCEPYDEQINIARWANIK